MKGRSTRSCCRAPDRAAIEEDTGSAIGGEEGRPVEIDEVAELPTTNAGAMARLVPTMLPTITCSPSRRDSLDHQQRLGQPAAFVELDVHDIEAADQACDVGETLNAFIGGERNRAIESSRFASRPRARGCSSRSTRASKSTGRAAPANRASSPGSHRRRARHRAALRAPPWTRSMSSSSSPLNLSLSARARQLRVSPQPLRRCRIVGAERERVSSAAPRARSCELPDGLSCAFRFQLPECAIQRIAGAANRHQLAQSGPRDARFDCARDALRFARPCAAGTSSK